MQDKTHTFAYYIANSCGSYRYLRLLRVVKKTFVGNSYNFLPKNLMLNILNQNLILENYKYINSRIVFYINFSMHFIHVLHFLKIQNDLNTNIYLCKLFLGYSIVPDY